MNRWGNLIGYQLVWFAAVAGAGRGLAWPGVAAALAFAAWQLARSRQRIADSRLVGAALLAGLVVDGAMGAAGFVQYAAGWPWAAVAPAWILALWVAFALTLNHSLAFLQPRPWLAGVLGAVGGPLAYAGAARGFGAAQLDGWPALLALAVGWGVALPLLAKLAARWARARPLPAPHVLEMPR